MKEEDNKIINEVLDEINTALNDPRGVEFHQRRIAFSISLGAVSLIENYLKKLNVFKTGSKINHLWLKKKNENAKKLIAKVISCSVESIKDFDDILNIAYKIENKRNELVYGKPISDKDLREYINLFFELKSKVEK